MQLSSTSHLPGLVKEENDQQPAVAGESTAREEAASRARSSKDSVSSTNGIMKKNMKGKPKPLHFWNSGDVNKWLRKHGGQCFDLYGEVLSQHDVTGRTLIRMNEIKLEKIGIVNLDHRKELMQHILRLRLKHELADLKILDQKGSGFELKLPETRVMPASVDKGDK